MNSSHGRRSFISTVASLAGLAAARVSAAQQPRGQAPAASGGFDMAWLDQMKGQHKQLYDLGGLELAVDRARSASHATFSTRSATCITSSIPTSTRRSGFRAPRFR